MSKHAGAPSRPHPLVEVRGVEKIYPGNSKVAALRGVDLTVDRGEFAALAGPSGSGKSTLLNLIGTLDRPTKGEILYEGAVVDLTVDGRVNRVVLLRPSEYELLLQELSIPGRDPIYEAALRGAANV